MKTNTSQKNKSLKGMNCSWKKSVAHFLPVIFFFLLLTSTFAQPLPPQPTFVNNRFNSGVNANASASLPVNSPDLYWRCNTTAVVPGLPAIVVNPVGSCFWSTLPGIPQWIAPNLNLCSGNPPSYYGCQPLTDFYFSNSFTLQPNLAFYLDILIFATGWIEDITVNGVIAYKRYGNPLSPPPLQGNNGLNFKWCDWKTNNTIIIHVANTPNISPYCKHTGIRVFNNTPQNYNYPAISGPTLVCAGSTNVYSIPNQTILGFPSPAYTYSWTLPPSLWGGTSNTCVIVAVTGTNSGIITANIYSVTSINGHTFASCATASAFSVTVPPPIIVSPVPASVCQGATLTLNASGASSYTWFAPPGLTQIGTGPAIAVSPSITTTYTVKGKTLLGNCTYSKTVVVTVKPTPNVSISAPTTTICSGNPVSLFAIGNAANYLWAPGLSTLTAVQYTPMATTIYSLYGSAQNGCTKMATVQIVVNPSPTVTAIPNPSVICSGTSATITASGANTYFWPQLGSAINPAIVSPTVSTAYIVNGTSTNSCSATTTVNVTVLTSPAVTFSPPAVCPGFANTLTATGAINYTWYIGSSPNQTVFTNTPTVVVNLSSVTPYTVCGIGLTNSCVACSSGTITSGSAIPISAPSITYCTNAGPCLSVSATSTLNVPVSYTWSAGPIGSTVFVCPTANTIYTISATSPSACPSSATMAVTLFSNCCAQSTVGLAALSPTAGLGGLYANTSYLLDGSITLTGNTFFQNSEVWITPGVSITVPPGIQLNLDQTHLYSCGNRMWQGIVVQDGGRITTTANGPTKMNSLIEDAEIAIDLSGISLLNASPNIPIDIKRVIFNRNFIGIRISNSVAGLDSLALGINGCIFSSRTMTYTTFQNLPLAWPSSEMSCVLGGLRCPSNPTNGLVPPYNFSPFIQSNLKLPHNMQGAHIGIQIEKIGDPNGINPTPGVQFGITYPGPVQNDFNLFDGLGVGIEVTDASLSTMNNVFQNMKEYAYLPAASGFYGGQGIKHIIQPNTLMNARLKLTATNSNNGNQFWDCISGVSAFNVYDCSVRWALFRSTHQCNTATNGISMPGDTGISVCTNRFDFGVKESQFNNLKYGIVLSTPPSAVYNYDFTGSGPTAGICVRGVTIERNYFGPEVTSLTPYSVSNTSNTTEYMGDAIQVLSPTTAGWSYHPAGANGFITSNKINRTFRGIKVDGTEDMPLTVAANSVHIEDDFTFGPSPGNPAIGYGISLSNKTDAMAIQFNTLEAEPWYNIAPPNNPTISLVYCTNNNFGNPSPRIECNSTKNAYFGFQFDADNTGTIWEGNEMCVHNAGMALTNNGIIGQQGSATSGSGNAWKNCVPNIVWSSPQSPFHTYCENSNPISSVLYVTNTVQNYPSVNSSNLGPPFEYPFGPSVIITGAVNRLYDCVGLHGYLHVPGWRINGVGAYTDLPSNADLNYDAIEIFPNPTNGQLTVVLPKNSANYSVSIFDLTGKNVYTKSNIILSSNVFDLSELPPSIYLVELKIGNQTFRKKLVKTN